MIADLGGLRLGYSVEGSGPAVLFVMGLGVERGGWELQVAAFRDRYTCITFDNRGIGESDVLPGRYQMVDMARDAQRLLQHLNIERPHVVGISMGGMIAQELALRMPIRSLALLATHGGDALPSVFTVARFAALQLSRDPDTRFHHVSRLLFSESFRIQHESELRVRLMDGALKRQQSLSGFVAQTEAVRRHRTHGRLGALAGTPVLLMHGSDDVCIRVQNLHKLAQELPWAEQHVLQGVGHGINVEAADALNAALADFWSRA